MKDPHVPLNYRGISLLSSIYKIYTSVLSNRISAVCENNNVLVDEQNSSRSGHCCIDHLFVLTSVIRNCINHNLSTFAAFINFQKAFDFIDRDLLLHKLHTFFGIDGKIYKAIKSLNSFSQSSVRVNDLSTDWFDVKTGVRQGDTLSPLLFSLFINDLAQGLNNLKNGINVNDNLQISILLYADDVVVMCPDEKKLNTCLQFVYNWCQKWRMAVNEDKTEIIHFRRKGKCKTSEEFLYGNSRLKVKDQYKYLGLVLMRT
jgi:hypothetical protein